MQAHEEPRRRGLRSTALVVCLLLSTTAAFSAARMLVPEGKGPGGAALYLWEPVDSYPGAVLHDSRLDSPVRFWRAGISLAELAAAIEEQTGVHLGFWPGADENPRIRLNVFLNPEDPPSLRDLLAQLAWVTGCTFACTSPAEQADHVYYLLDSSHTARASERWRDLRIARSFTDEDRRELSRQQHLAATGAMLEELRAALRLSHNTLVSRYRNRNDHLLLTLLDPPRRAAAEFVCGRMSYRDDGSRWYRIGEDWGALSEAEKELLRAAFPGIEDIGQTQELRVTAHGAHFGIIELTVSRLVAREDGRYLFPVDEPIPVVDSREDATVLAEPGNILHLAALLGESVPEGEEAAYVGAYVGSEGA